MDMLNLAVEKINIKLILNSVRKILLFFIDYKNMQKKTVDLSKMCHFGRQNRLESGEIHKAKY